MTKYTEVRDIDTFDYPGGYRDGIDAVLTYIESIHAYPKLLGELEWAIREGII